MALSALHRSKTDPKLDALTDEIRTLAKRVAELKGEREAIGDAARLDRQIASLVKEKTTLEIELDRVKETHEREKREIEHKTGLHRQKVEQDIALARREAEVSVREENLTAAQSRFEETMKFMRERFEKEVEYLHAMVGEVLERMPKVTYGHQIDETRGNGKREEEVPA
jgi:chromosome segregation ATPase